MAIGIRASLASVQITRTDSGHDCREGQVCRKRQRLEVTECAHPQLKQESRDAALRKIQESTAAFDYEEKGVRGCEK